jgi:hypothetical protein
LAKEKELRRHEQKLYWSAGRRNGGGAVEQCLAFGVAAWL